MADCVALNVADNYEVGGYLRNASDPGQFKREKNPDKFEQVPAKAYESKKFLPMYKPKKKKRAPPREAFGVYNADSHNANATVSPERQQEIDTILFQYKQLYYQRQGNPIPEDFDKIARKTLPTDLNKKEARLRSESLGITKPSKDKKLANVMVNCFTQETKAEMKKTFSSEAPVRKQKVLIPPEKRVKRRQRPASPPGQHGKEIKYDPFKTQPVPAIQKKDFKYFKPWLVEQNVPKWVSDIQEAKLSEVINAEGGQEALKTQEKWWKRVSKNSCELPIEFYQKFKNNDTIKSYAQLAPRRTEPRLQAIYRQFKTKLADYQEDLAEGFNLDGKEIQPAKIRDRLVEQRERQERAQILKDEIDRQVAEELGLSDDDDEFGAAKPEVTADQGIPEQPVAAEQDFHESSTDSGVSAQEVEASDSNSDSDVASFEESFERGEDEGSEFGLGDDELEAGDQAMVKPEHPAQIQSDIQFESDRSSSAASCDDFSEEEYSVAGTEFTMQLDSLVKKHVGNKLHAETTKQEVGEEGDDDDDSELSGFDFNNDVVPADQSAPFSNTFNSGTIPTAIQTKEETKGQPDEEAVEEAPKKIYKQYAPRKDKFATQQRKVDTLLAGEKMSLTQLKKRSTAKPSGKLSMLQVDTWLKNMEREQLTLEKTDAVLIDRINESHKNTQELMKQHDINKEYDESLRYIMAENKKLQKKSRLVPREFKHEYPPPEVDELSEPSSHKSIGQNYRETCDMVKKFIRVDIPTLNADLSTL